MSDGITDAERQKREEVELWRKKVMEQFLSELSITTIVEDLVKRPGVTVIVVPPHEWYEIGSDREQWDAGVAGDSPARILVVTD